MQETARKHKNEMEKTKQIEMTENVKRLTSKIAKGTKKKVRKRSDTIKMFFIRYPSNFMLNTSIILSTGEVNRKNR